MAREQAAERIRKKSLRLLAWRTAHVRPGKGGRKEPYEAYECRSTCFAGGESDAARRRSWRCTLTDWEPSRWGAWTPSGSEAWGPYMGATPAIADGPIGLDEPPESHEDGCPGGWYRGRFAISLLRYERPFCDGTFSGSALLDRCSDPLVLECVRYYERQLIASRSFRQDGLYG